MAVTWGATGCVTQGTFDRAVAAGAASVRARDTRIAQIEAGLRDARAQLTARDAKIAEIDAARSNAIRALDEATAIDQHLREELTRLGRDARARLAELRAAQEAASRRTQTFAQLAGALRPRIDDGSLTVVLRHERVVVTIAGDLLFDSTKAELRPTAKTLLADVATALHALGDRRLEIGAYVDPLPVAAPVAAPTMPATTSPTPHLDDRWSFTAARAVAVIVALSDLGLPSAKLSATAFGTHDPIADNDTAEGRARNRRIEIALRPDDRTAEAIVPVVAAP
jgi:chemotaxis protein MotB